MMSNQPLRIFIGYDERQTISYTVLQHSIVARAKRPVSITPLTLWTLPINRRGLTPFTYSRFLVPYLCDYQGMALFLDADMLLTDDVSKLFDIADPDAMVSVVRHEKAFEWASVMMFNCAKCTHLTPHFVETQHDLHRLSWAQKDQIGELPREWNFLVGYDKPNKDETNPPSLIHYTQGVPAFPETRGCDYAELWHSDARIAMSAQPWATLMGNSVHAIEFEGGKKMPRLTLGEDRIAELIEEQRNAQASAAQTA